MIMANNGIMNLGVKKDPAWFEVSMLLVCQLLQVSFSVLYFHIAISYMLLPHIADLFLRTAFIESLAV